MLTHMKLKIGVMGSAGGALMEERLSLAFILGQAIAQAGCYLVTGGCPGLPLAAARGAKTVGGLVIGISPGLSLDEHIPESTGREVEIAVFTNNYRLLRDFTFSPNG